MAALFYYSSVAKRSRSSRKNNGRLIGVSLLNSPGQIAAWSATHT